MKKVNWLILLMVVVFAANSALAQDVPKQRGLLQMFNLSGPVKKAVFVTNVSFLGFPEKEKVVEFSESGIPEELLGDGIEIVDRSDEKFVVKDGDKTHTWLFVGIGDEVRVKKYLCESPEMNASFFLAYAGKDVSQEQFQGVVPATGDKFESVVDYTVLDRDKYGNWTRRKAKISGSKEVNAVESCLITYYTPEEIAEGLVPPPPSVVPEISEILLIDEDKLEESLAEDVDDDAVYETVEQMPSYPGGESAMFSHIARNLRYPMLAAENGVQGRVVVSVVVNKDGSLTISDTSGVDDPSLVKEAERVIRTLSKFTPGKQNGKVVKVKMNIPVNFILK